MEFNMSKENLASLDIDLNDFDKEQLIKIISYAHERDLTFNQTVVELLTKFIEYNKAFDE
jgi:hypothetical protein